jgi:hypothetical protein
MYGRFTDAETLRGVPDGGVVFDDVSSQFNGPLGNILPQNEPLPTIFVDRVYAPREGGYDCGRSVFGKGAQKRGAAGEDVPPGRLEITGVPRIGHLASGTGKRHEQSELSVRIAAEQACHITEVVFMKTVST